MWLTRDGYDSTRAGGHYALWRYRPKFDKAGSMWLADFEAPGPRGAMNDNLNFPASTFHRKHSLRLPPGKAGICRVDLALTRRGA